MSADGWRELLRIKYSFYSDTNLAKLIRLVLALGYQPEDVSLLCEYGVLIIEVPDKITPDVEELLVEVMHYNEPQPEPMDGWKRMAEALLECDECGQICASQSGLGVHKARSHPKVESEPSVSEDEIGSPNFETFKPQVEHPCEDCGFIARSASGLAIHRKHRHGWDPTADLSDLNLPKPEKDDTGVPRPYCGPKDPMLVCNSCGDWYTNSAATLAIHTGVAHKREPNRMERTPVSDEVRKAILERFETATANQGDR